MRVNEPTVCESDSVAQAIAGSELRVGSESCDE